VTVGDFELDVEAVVVLLFHSTIFAPGAFFDIQLSASALASPD